MQKVNEIFNECLSIIGFSKAVSCKFDRNYYVEYPIMNYNFYLI